MLKKPGFSVRPRMLSQGYDFIAFGGLFGVDRHAARRPSRACARRSRARTFASARRPASSSRSSSAPAPDFPLVAPQGDDFAFHFGHGMEGEMVVNGQSTSLAELAAQGRTTISPIPASAKIRVRAGKTTFLVSSVPRPRRHAMPLFAALESRVLAYFAGSLDRRTWASGCSCSRFPSRTRGTNIDLASLEDTSTRSNSTNQDDPPPPEEEDKPDDGEEESGGTGTAMALDEGKMGKKDSDRAEGQYKMQKNQEDPQLARQQAIEQARNAGILGSTALVQGGAFASLTGTGDISSGFDDSNIYGGLLGNEAGEMNGGFGFGRSGFGPGGGGTGWGTIGTGRYGTIGHGSGTGSGYGVVKDAGAGARPEADDVQDLGGAVVTPGLVDAHHHLWQNLTRARAQDENLFGWLKALYPIWSAIDEEAEYAAARVGLAELALSGCTTVFDHHYLFPPGVTGVLEAEIRAARDLGVRIVASRGSMDLGESQGGLPPDSVVESRDDALAATEAAAALADDAQVGITVAPCSPFSVTRELMIESAELARRLGLRSTHTSRRRSRRRTIAVSSTGARPSSTSERWAGSPTTSGAHTAYTSRMTTSRPSARKA